MQQAFDAMSYGNAAEREAARIALRDRLAQPEQEPVTLHVDRLNQWLDASLKDRKPAREQPPQRKPLTDVELADLWYKQSLDWLEFGRAIEAAHGIKGEA